MLQPVLHYQGSEDANSRQMNWGIGSNAYHFKKKKMLSAIYSRCYGLSDHVIHTSEKWLIKTNLMFRFFFFFLKCKSLPPEGSLGDIFYT